MPDQPHAGPRRPDSPGDAEAVLHTWEARMHVLSNPSAWSGVTLSLGGGALGLGLLFVAISKSVAGLYVSAAIFGGLMLVFMLVGGVIDLCGGFRVRFAITSRGVRSVSGKGARAAANTALVGGIITGSLTGMAAGQLARSEQDVFIPYAEVARVKVSGRRRYILVKGHWGQKPIGLSCRTADFSEILRILRERCSLAQFSGDA
jgi:hypothetical protein